MNVSRQKRQLREVHGQGKILTRIPIMMCIFTVPSLFPKIFGGKYFRVTVPFADDLREIVTELEKIL